MTIRRKIWTLGATSMMLAAVIACMVSIPLVSVTSATRDAIVPGMTVAEASAIIGGPPRWYDGIHSFGGGVPSEASKSSGPSWVSNDGQIVLELDNGGNVTAAAYAPVRVCDQDLTQLWVERLTRGMGESVMLAALLALTVIVGAAIARLRLIRIGFSSVGKEVNPEGPGLWLGVGSWFVAVYAWRKRPVVG